jgi:hypothetical protein
LLVVSIAEFNVFRIRSETAVRTPRRRVVTDAYTGWSYCTAYHPAKARSPGLRRLGSIRDVRRVARLHPCSGVQD